MPETTPAIKAAERSLMAANKAITLSHTCPLFAREQKMEEAEKAVVALFNNHFKSSLLKDQTGQILTGENLVRAILVLDEIEMFHRSRTRDSSFLTINGIISQQKDEINDLLKTLEFPYNIISYPEIATLFSRLGEEGLLFIDDTDLQQCVNQIKQIIIITSGNMPNAAEMMLKSSISARLDKIAEQPGMGISTKLNILTDILTALRPALKKRYLNLDVFDSIYKMLGNLVEDHPEILFDANAVENDYAALKNLLILFDKRYHNYFAKAWSNIANYFSQHSNAMEIMADILHMPLSSDGDFLPKNTIGELKLGLNLPDSKLATDQGKIEYVLTVMRSGHPISPIAGFFLYAVPINTLLNQKPDDLDALIKYVFSYDAETPVKRVDQLQHIGVQLILKKFANDNDKSMARYASIMPYLSLIPDKNLTSINFAGLGFPFNCMQYRNSIAFLQTLYTRTAKQNDPDVIKKITIDTIVGVKDRVSALLAYADWLTDKCTNIADVKEFEYLVENVQILVAHIGSKAEAANVYACVCQGIVKSLSMNLEIQEKQRVALYEMLERLIASGEALRRDSNGEGISFLEPLKHSLFTNEEVCDIRLLRLILGLKWKDASNITWQEKLNVNKITLNAALEHENFTIFKDAFASLVEMIEKNIKAGRDEIVAEAIKVFLDEPDYRFIRTVLGLMPAESDPQNFKKEKYWKILEDIKSMLTLEQLGYIDASVLVQWYQGKQISPLVCRAAAELFELVSPERDKISAQAAMKPGFNPLLAAYYLDKTCYDKAINSPALQAVAVHYLEHNFKQMVPLASGDKLKVFSYLMAHADEIEKKMKWYELHEFIDALLDKHALSKVDLHWLQLALDKFYGQPIFIDLLLHKLGFNIENQVISGAELDDFFYKAIPASTNGLDRFLAKELFVERLLQTQHFRSAEAQSAHDEKLATRFDAIVAQLQADKALIMPINPEEQKEYLRLFALFSLFKINPEADVFVALFKHDKNLRAELFAEMTFLQFYNKFKTLPTTTGKLDHLLYILNGGDVNIADAAKAEYAAALQQKFDHAEQYNMYSAMAVMRTFSGINQDSAVSWYFSDAQIRAGVVATIAYASIDDPHTYLQAKIISHADIAKILINVEPTDLWYQLYAEWSKNNLASNPFVYTDYAAIIEKIFTQHREQDFISLVTGISDALLAYVEEGQEATVDLQSCKTGSKTRLMPVYKDDVLFGEQQARKIVIENCVYEVIKELINKKLLELATKQDKKVFLSKILNVTKYNALGYAEIAYAHKDPDKIDFLNPFTDAELFSKDANGMRHWLPISLSAALGISESDLDAAVAAKFVHSPYYIVNTIVKGVAEPLDIKEIDAISLMLSMNGGDKINQRLQLSFADYCKVEKKPDTSSTQADRELNDLVARIYSSAEGQAIADPTYTTFTPVHKERILNAFITQMAGKLVGIANSHESRTDEATDKAKELIGNMLRQNSPEKASGTEKDGSLIPKLRAGFTTATDKTIKPEVQREIKDEIRAALREFIGNYTAAELPPLDASSRSSSPN